MGPKKSGKSLDRSRSPKKEEQRKPRKRSTSRSRTANGEKQSRKESRKEPKSRSKSASRQSINKKQDAPKTRGRSTSRSRKSAPAVAAIGDGKPIPQSPPVNNLHVNVPSKKENVDKKTTEVSVEAHVTLIPPPKLVDSQDISKYTDQSNLRSCCNWCQNACDWFGFSLPWFGPLGAIIFCSILLLLPFLVSTVATHKEPSLFHLFPILETLYTFFYKDRLQYFYLPVIGWYTTFLLFQLLVGLLPLGRSVEGIRVQHSATKKGLMYRCTGLARLIITVLLFSAFCFWRKDDLIYMRHRWRALLGSMGLVGILVGLLFYFVSLLPAYFASKRVPSVDKGFWPYGALVGSLLHPRLPAFANGALDVKLWSLETSLISWLVLDGLWLVGKTDHYQALCLAYAHVAFVFVFFLQERPILIAPTFTEEGYGLIQSILSLFTLPWIMSMPICFLTHAGSSAEWCLSLRSFIFAGLFFVALVIFNLTRQVKMEFQVDPYNPDHVCVISGDGNRVFADGPYWLIRHPQSLCQLVMLFAHSAFIGFDFLLPWTMFFLGAMIVVYNMFKEEKRCLSVYGKAYAGYKSTVPYMLIPYLL